MHSRTKAFNLLTETEHEKVCDFRKINCPDLACKADVDFLHLLSHVDQAHPKVNSRFKITAFDRTFFAVGKIKDNIMYYWVYILASPDEAKNYFYRATLKGESEKEFSSYCQVRSLNESCEEIIANHDTFAIPVRMAKRFTNDELKIKFKVFDCATISVARIALKSIINDIISTAYKSS